MEGGVPLSSYNNAHAQLLGRTNNNGDRPTTLVEHANAWFQTMKETLGDHVGKVICPLWMSICNNMSSPLRVTPSSRVGQESHLNDPWRHDERDDGFNGQSHGQLDVQRVKELEEILARKEEQLHMLKQDHDRDMQLVQQEMNAARELHVQQLQLLDVEHATLQERCANLHAQIHELRSTCEQEVATLHCHLHNLSRHHDQMQQSLLHHMRHKLGDELHQKLYDVEHVRIEHVTHVQEKINGQHMIFSRLHHDAQVALTSIGSTIATL